MGGAIPGLVVLSSVRKQIEQAKGSKPVSSTPPWPLPQLLPPGSHHFEVLFWVPSRMEYTVEVKGKLGLSSLDWLWSRSFITVVETLRQSLVHEILSKLPVTQPKTLK